MNHSDNPTPEKSETDPTSNLADINQQTGVVEWQELEKHFARGVVIAVSAELDLVELAQIMSQDDSTQVQEWLSAGSIKRASDDDAREWHSKQQQFWCVVVAPWVLVQEKSE